MGLMLSVFVFFVGVVEVLDCWQHFLLYLVQPQHNPLPFHVDPKADVLCERELSSIFESRKPSRVDICWPRDLSPTDDLHVIKKRSHSENERRTDQDREPLGHHSTRNVDFHDKHSDQSQLPMARSSTPKIEIHCIDDDGIERSPLTSRENSPGLLELDVIVESDSSSEFDEPSQIENIAYVMKVKSDLENSVVSNDSVASSEKQSILCESNEETPSNTSSSNQLEECSVSPTSLIGVTLEEETQTLNVEESSVIALNKTALLKEYPALNENDAIDSSNISPYSSAEECQSRSNLEQLDMVQTKKWLSEDTIDSSEPDSFYSLSEAPVESFPQNIDDLDNLHTDSCNEEDLFSVTDVPEVTLRESSPVPVDDSTDSSLNTSDASWMVKSRTSDRPLVIRFNPEAAASDFTSVAKTGLQAFDDNHKILEAANRDAKESDHFMSESQELSRDLSGGKGTSSRERPLQTTQAEDDLAEPNGLEASNMAKHGNNFGEEHKTSTQLETNSSSSSLSGIPQIPEDIRDFSTNTSLPSDNGFGDSSLQRESDDLKSSHSGSDYLVQTSSGSLELEGSKSEMSDNKNVLQVTDPCVDLENTGKTHSSDLVLPESVENICGQPLEFASQENILEGDVCKSSVENLPNSPFLENLSSKVEAVANTKSEVFLKTDESPVLEPIAQSSKPSSSLPEDEEQLAVSSKSNVLSQSGEPPISESAVQPTEPFSTLSKDEEEPVINAKSDVPVQSGESPISGSVVHSNEPNVSVPDYGEQPVVNTKSNDGPQISGPIAQSSEPKSLPTEDERKAQSPVNSATPEGKTIDNTCELETEPSDADFKPKPLQRRDTKRKSKITPRTFSREDSSKSDEIEVICLENEPSETNRSRNEATSVSINSKNTDSTNPPSLDKPVLQPSTKASPSVPSKVEQELIFSGEYTKAMNKDWHSGHFCCWQCDESLTGQRYVLRDEHPYCIKCYESVFANGCEECNKTIGIDSKDLSYKDKHWHEACFLCNKCRVSLVDKQFGSKLDKIFCANCYDAQFASRCDGCGQIFKAGTKKMEYKTRQWHEPCFACCVCKTAIGTKSFIPREQEIYCATCYEEKFATRCVKCNKIITSGGVTYKNEPWHRECFTCTNCSTSLAGQRFTSRDEKPYCADCFGELFAKRCTACCKPITGIGGTRFISFEERHWHNDCFICASCKTSLVGRGFITDAEDIICPECAKQKLM